MFVEEKTRRRERVEQKKEEPPEVRCPKCGWKHDWRPHWICELCDAYFDTFVTHANCPDPSCRNVWVLTWCPRCGDPSPHEAWYVSGGLYSPN